MVVLISFTAGSACAESLTPDAARRFVAGKLFAFNCFDGSRGEGRIYDDGSVIMPFEPCFHLEKIDARSFRGSWMGFAYCDFTRRMSVAGMGPQTVSP
jgi:hypothetical protein